MTPIPIGARVTWIDLVRGLRSGVVMAAPAVRTTRVRSDDTGAHEHIPTHWLTDTCERVLVVTETPACAACIAAEYGDALFPWEIKHTCRLRGAA